MDFMYLMWGVTILLSGGVLFAVVILMKKQKSGNLPPASPEDEARSKEVLREAQNKSREMILEAKDKAYNITRQAEQDREKKRRELYEQEKQIEQKETHLGKNMGVLEERERFLKEQQEKLDRKENEIEDVKKKQLEKLQRVASLTQEEARNIILKAVEKQLDEDISKRIKEAEEDIQEAVEEKSKEVLIQAIQSGATDYVAEFTTSTVKIEDEDMKGRIIGREGRNIKTFEKYSGVDVSVDETPGIIQLSSFNSLRREIARQAMEKLIVDGRIQPSRIEEEIQKAEKRVDKIVKESGEKLVYDAGVGGLPRKIVDVLGRFRYRTSYGQNMINHTLEVVKIGEVLASEIKANIKLVKMACLLHDIGKVLQEDSDGNHVQIGVDFLRKFDVLPEEVIHAVEAHHEDVPFKSVEAIIVKVADAISGARPGARYEDFEGYMKRVTEMENIAKSFSGVAKSFAIQAGREVRVLVIPEQISDANVAKLAHDIADKIHDEVIYPGSVKVNVIREIRASEIAK